MIKNRSGSVVIIISADIEWQAVCSLLKVVHLDEYPFGQWFWYETGSDKTLAQYRCVRGGWGKISAAASTQYVIDIWKPEVILNLGTCGGFAGKVEPGRIILVERTIVYDIIEQMGDQNTHIQHYTTDLDLSWLDTPYPQPVLMTTMISADRDLIASELNTLNRKYQACVGDWESGAIAWVAHRNGTRCLILRGVTDLVGPDGGEAYNGQIHFYHQQTEVIFQSLLAHLPAWLTLITNSNM
ncbi:5'-methylthioadenosine/S-adenosylhomocysteine nucleosidase [bacterium]|nr:5'-methylthioadenosine/S-adenosylhomocysteine nucleosidase [bacterium]